MHSQAVSFDTAEVYRLPDSRKKEGEGGEGGVGTVVPSLLS